MRPDPTKIIEDALQLDPAARALMAKTLLESLDVGEDFPVSDAWREEIRRRCAEIDSGTVALVPGNEVLAELRAKYG
jgi:putative addiction module component (TIGR02574 family)